MSGREEFRLTEALLRWRQKWPGVRVEEVCLQDVAAGAVVAAARGISLAVLGHRQRPASEARIGPVATAALRSMACPVALVPYG